MTPYTLRHMYNITSQPNPHPGATIMAALEFNGQALLPSDTARFAEETALAINVSKTIHPLDPADPLSVEVHTFTLPCMPGHPSTHCH